jgi:multidrug efflux pump subunit AcrA (membrane-fusion protein)
MKTFIKTVVGLIVAILLALLGAKVVKEKQAEDAAQPTATIYPIVAQTILPKKSNVTLTLPYLAESVNDTDVSIASRISARIVAIKKSGAQVRKGEVVAKLDTTDLNADIESAKIALINLIKTHKRTMALYKVKGASIEQLQKEESAIASLKAKLKNLKNQLSYADLIAPVDGVVAKTFAAEGGMAVPGKALLKINASEGFSLLVRTPSDITPPALLYHGKRYKLHPLGSSYHGLNEYKAFIDGSGLTTGDKVEVSVIIYSGQGILLPFDAVLNREGKSYILAAENKRAAAHEITILQSGQEGIVVESLPKEGAIVVAKPDILLKLTSGYALEVKE